MSRIIAAITIGLLAGSHIMWAQQDGQQEKSPSEEYFTQYSNQPLPVYYSTGNRPQTVYIVGKIGDNLIIREKPNSRQEVTIPLSSDFTLQFRADKRFKRALDQISRGDYNKAIPVMRPMAYTMFRYLGLPEEKSNVHEYVIEYINSLIAIDKDAERDEAFEMLRRVDYLAAPDSLKQVTLNTIGIYANLGRSDQALTLFNLLAEIDENPAQLLPYLWTIAYDMRAAGDFDRAVALYQQAIKMGEGNEKNRARIWASYCFARLGNIRNTELYLSTVKDVNETERLFSLKMLVDGYLAFSNENYAEALAKLTRGVAFSNISYEWNGELLFYSARSYEETGSVDVARQIFGEVMIMHPNTEFQKKATSKLDEMKAEG